MLKSFQSQKHEFIQVKMFSVLMCDIADVSYVFIVLQEKKIFIWLKNISNP